ncbi:MAG: HAMP domain-containing sensor histidine kinase, partial [Oscillospiraceae bacterium]
FEKRLTHMLPAKIAAFILLAFTSILSVGYAMGGLVMLNYDAIIVDFRGIHLSDYTSAEQPLVKLASKLLENAHDLGYWTFFICIGALLLSVGLFVFLMCSSGHKKGQDEVSPGLLNIIPFDVIVAAFLLTFFLAAQFFFEAFYLAVHSFIPIFALPFLLAAAALIFTGFCMCFATRLKLGGWWKNTLIYHAFSIAWIVLRVIFRAIWRTVKGLFRGAALIFRKLPLIWKTAVLVFGISFVEFICLCLAYHGGLFFFAIIKLLLIPAILFIAILMRRLKKGAKMIAEGDLSYHVDTKYMFWDFKEHGENLNSIGLGTARAVDERMKSERLKTELITNVSHDIKTPLTSIINYVDLISKEDCENEKIVEYTEVLARQSERLKKLIEDLVEASKVSTGNVEVALAPCDVGVLLTQTAGEYEQRLEASSLALILSSPKSPVTVMADGRLIWRVFDNLMNNVCKYSQPGTRVYLSLEVLGGEALVSLKNTSKSALNISSEELMERFVRGDSSRSTEGSGLGLSIAKSLTELQNGDLDLVIDGDLFKVTLKFKAL